MSRDAIETVVRRLVREFGGTLTKGEWYRASGLARPQANSLAAQLKLRHFQVRDPAPSGDEKWELQFR